MSELTTITNLTPGQIQSINRQGLAKAIFKLNLAVNHGFGMSDATIERYAETIMELRPELTPALLNKIINKILKNELPYDVSTGLRGIFLAYNEHVRYRAYFTVVHLKEPQWIEVSEDDDFTAYAGGDWRIIEGRANCKELFATPPGIVVPIQWMDKQEYYLSEGHQRRMHRFRPNVAM